MCSPSVVSIAVPVGVHDLRGRAQESQMFRGTRGNLTFVWLLLQCIVRLLFINYKLVMYVVSVCGPGKHSGSEVHCGWEGCCLFLHVLILLSIAGDLFLWVLFGRVNETKHVKLVDLNKWWLLELTRHYSVLCSLGSWHRTWWEGSVNKGACPWAWQPEFTPGTHMIKGKHFPPSRNK